MVNKNTAEESFGLVHASVNQQILQSLLLGITQRLASKTGTAFFHALTQSLARSLRADYVLIGRLANPDADELETLSVFSIHAENDKLSENFCYELAGSLCADIIATGSCCYPGNVCQQFPNDTVMQAMGVSACVGTVMQNSQHQPIGILMALWCKPFTKEATEATALAEQLLAVFAVRTAAEMERQQALDTLRCQNALLSRIAYEDTLTGLPNRLAFLHVAKEHLLQNSSDNHLIMTIDIVRFREINEGMGYQAGNQLLCSVATRIQQSAHMQKIVLLARLDGDRFALLLQGNQMHFVIASQDIQHCIREPFDCNDITIKVDFHIGGALCGTPSSNTEETLRLAEIALFAAKKRESHCCLYEASMDNNSKEKLLLLTDLRRALNSDELTLFYQPKKRAHDGGIASCEALLRWKHTEKGMIPPGDFIPLAENSELIHPITFRVIRMSLEQICTWKKAGFSITVAVNISAHNLMDDTFVQKTCELLESYPEAKGLLEMEITEGVLMSDPKRAATVLYLLSKMNIPIAIDDFGTGYSSLAYLKKLPINSLKIDRSFVMDMEKDTQDRVIVKSTIDLAHNLGLSVVAEGVETKTQMDDLIQMGCDYLQGYFIGRPAPAAELNALLTTPTTLNFSI
jgi:diguanylate cyclase (GGDEF)-like protein